MGVPSSRCMLAIEHQGTTNQHARKFGGDRLAGYVKQCEDDYRKAAAVANLGLEMLYVTVCRNDVTDGALSQRCMQQWEGKLKNTLVAMENASAIAATVLEIMRCLVLWGSTVGSRASSLHSAGQQAWYAPP